MPATNDLQVSRFVPHAGPDNRIWFRSDGGSRIQHLAVSGFSGPAMPGEITHLALERRQEAGSDSWRLTCDQGVFDFEAQAVERIETRPALYAGLHRPFALSQTDRVAVRCLLALLRLPGGAKLLRLWHDRRGA